MDFALEGVKWGQSSTFGTSGGTVTWSYSTAINSAFAPEIQAAFDQWSSVSNINFSFIQDPSVAQIDLGFASIDGEFGLLSKSSHTSNGSLITHADITFDSAEHWTSGQKGLAISNDYYFITVAMHEIGESIGLGRYDGVLAVMNSALPENLTTLTSSDIHGAVAIYGAQPAGFDNPIESIASFGATAGAGGWTSETAYPRLLADVNGDGMADIVGFGNAGALVSLATGGGQFANPIAGIASFGATAEAGGWSSNDTYPRMLADVNGDGMADIVGFGNAGTLVSLATSGGHFAAPITGIASFGATAEAGGWISEDPYPRMLADVNGDGMADIVGFGNAGTLVSLATGGGHFAAPITGIASFGATAEAGGWISEDTYPRMLADVNGDGMADIVGFGNDGVLVSLATGGGHFASPINASPSFGATAGAGGWSSEHDYPRELADINGDGKADILGFGNNGVFYALGQGDGTFGAIHSDIGSFGASASAGGWINNDLYPRVLADITGDHHADIVGFGNAGVLVSLAHDFLLV